MCYDPLRFFPCFYDLFFLDLTVGLLFEIFEFSFYFNFQQLGCVMQIHVLTKVGSIDNYGNYEFSSFLSVHGVEDDRVVFRTQICHCSGCFAGGDQFSNSRIRHSGMQNPWAFRFYGGLSSVSPWIADRPGKSLGCSAFLSSNICPFCCPRKVCVTT